MADNHVARPHINVLLRIGIVRGRPGADPPELNLFCSNIRRIGPPRTGPSLNWGPPPRIVVAGRSALREGRAAKIMKLVLPGS